jgi:hypothetical protein
MFGILPESSTFPVVLTQLVGLDLNPGNMGVDKVCVLELCRYVEVIADRLGHNRLDRWDSADGAGLLGSSLQQGRRDVIAVADAPFADMARAHPVAAIIEDAAD